MSLVAYASSDDSDSEETSTTPAPPSKFSSTGLFSLLPAPKKSASAPRHDNGPNTEIRMNLATAASVSNDELEAPKRSFFSSLPKPKKRTEPVKITVPQIQRRDVSLCACLILIRAPVFCSIHNHSFFVYSQILMMMTYQQRRNCKVR